MEIEYLKEFLVYSQSLNYSTAAKALFIAQPTLSQHIAKMSSDLGMPLVSQSGKAHLTPAGEVLCSYAQSIVSEYDAMLQTFGNMKAQQGKTIRIVDIRPSLDFVSEINAVRQTYDDSPPKVEYVDDKAIFQLSEFQVLDDNLADISFTFASDDSMGGFSEAELEIYGFLPLRPELCLFVLAYDHPLAQQETVSLNDLSGMRITTVKTPFWLRAENASLETFQKKGYAFSSVSGTIKSKFILPANDHKYASITYEDAVVLNPVAFADGNELATLRVSDFDFTVQPYAIFRKDNPNETVADFVNRWRKELENA